MADDREKELENGNKDLERERSKSVGDIPSKSVPIEKENNARPRSQSAPTNGNSTEVKKPKTEYGAYEEKSLDILKIKKESEHTSVGLNVGASAKYGASNKGLVATAEVSAEAQAALKTKIEGRVADMDATGAAKLEAAAKLAASIGANLSKSGLKVEADATAKATATANANGTIKVSDKQSVNGGVEAEAYAEAKATATAKLGPDGAETEFDATAGVGAKIGYDIGGKEGDNTIKYSPRVVFGKVGAGFKGGVTHNSGKVGVDVKYTVNLGVGVELKFKAEYSTDQVAAAGRKALERLKAKHAEIDASTGHSFEDKTDGTVRVINSHIAVISHYGDNLAEEGSKQGGVVGAIHVGSGTVIKYGGKVVESVGSSVVETGGTIIKTGSRVIDFFRSW